MKPVFIFLAVALIALHACKKDKPVSPGDLSTPVSPGNSNYLPLSTGNYWVYQMSDEDSSGNFTYNNTYDSVYVSKDTTINGQTYFEFRHSNANCITWYLNPIYLRDSSGYLIDQSSEPFFDPVHINDTIRTYYQVWSGNYYLIPRLFQAMTTPSGTYSGIMMTVSFPNAATPISGMTLTTYKAFTKNTGMVRIKTGFASSPWTGTVAQLVRYHLN